MAPNVSKNKLAPDFGKEHAATVLDIIGWNEDEEPLHAVRRHWTVLLSQLAIPVLIALVCGGIAFFLAMGGSLLVISDVYAGNLDIVNAALLAAFLLVVFMRLVPHKESKSLNNQMLVIAALLFLFMFGFRYFLGGRLFVLDTVASSVTGGSTVVTIGLLLVTVLAAMVAFYIYFEWQDDFLVLTNQRVITFHRQLLGAHKQNQMAIADVQSVQGKTTSYLEHWFGYGTITIQSATLGRNMMFINAGQPWAMRDAIGKRVKQVKDERSAQSWAGIIDQKVFGKPAPPPPPKPKPKSSSSASKKMKKPFFLSRPVKQKSSRKQLASNVPGMLRVLGIPDNPHVEYNDNEEIDSITWRRHWVFLILGIFKPTMLMLVGIAAAITAIILNFIGVVLGIFLIIGLLLISMLWLWWEFEDYINDPYVLNRKEVVDVEKKPFGPEDRRSAGLGAIQNVNLNTSFISRMFGFGDVFLDTAGAGGKFTFEGVPNPNEVVSTINTFLVDFRRGEEQRTINNSINLLIKYEERRKYWIDQHHQASGTEGAEGAAS